MAGFRGSWYGLQRYVLPGKSLQKYLIRQQSNQHPDSTREFAQELRSCGFLMALNQLKRKRIGAGLWCDLNYFIYFGEIIL